MGIINDIENADDYSALSKKALEKRIKDVAYPNKEIMELFTEKGVMFINCGPVYTREEFNYGSTKARRIKAGVKHIKN